MVQNAVANIISRTPSTLVLHLHWLQRSHCIQNPALTFEALNKLALQSFSTSAFSTPTCTQVLLLLHPAACSSDHFGLKKIQKLSPPGHQNLSHPLLFQIATRFLKHAPTPCDTSCNYVDCIFSLFNLCCFTACLTYYVVFLLYGILECSHKNCINIFNYSLSLQSLISCSFRHIFSAPSCTSLNPPPVLSVCGHISHFV